MRPRQQSRGREPSGNALFLLRPWVGVAHFGAGFFGCVHPIDVGTRGIALAFTGGDHLKFPANREINREFRGNRPSTRILTPNRPANSMVYNQIPKFPTQWNRAFSTRIRENFSKNREFSLPDAQMLRF
jgi:hypothetical protein